MRLLGKRARKGDEGEIRLVPEDGRQLLTLHLVSTAHACSDLLNPCIDCSGEDMWHAYNLIREGDAVTATTFRKVQKDSGGTSAGASERIKIKITVRVEDVDFDAEGVCICKQQLHCHGLGI